MQFALKIRVNFYVKRFCRGHLKQTRLPHFKILPVAPTKVETLIYFDSYVRFSILAKNNNLRFEKERK